jgi:hemoglobin
MVLAIAVFAGVGVLLWISRSDDTARGTDESAQNQTEPERAPLPALGGDDAAGEATPPPAGEALHDRLGGRKAIFAMTGKLLEALQKNEVIMANDKLRQIAERVNVRKLHERLTNFVCKEAGGPCKYTGRPMKEYIAQLNLTSAEWDAVDGDLAAVLTELQVPDKEAQELMALFAALRDDSAPAD